MAISSTPEKLQQVNDEIGDSPSVSSIPFIYIESAELKLRNVQVRENLVSGSNSLIAGHPINGIVGTAIGLGGGQIVVGSSGSNVEIDLVKRSYEWKSTTDFQRGTKSDNIDVSQGFIQLGNVTIKNISLEHKENKNN